MPDVGFDGDALKTSPSERRAISPLFRLALASGAAPAVSMQLKLGAPVDGRDTGGRSPLMLCASKGHLQLCRLLLEAGADWSLTDDTGHDALTLASTQGHDTVVALIRSLAGPAGTPPVLDQSADAEAMPSEDPAPLRVTAVSVQESLTEDAMPPAAIGQHEPEATVFGTAWNVPASPEPASDTTPTDVSGTTGSSTAQDLIPVLPASADQDDALGEAGADAWSGWDVEEDSTLAPSDAGVEAAARSLELAASVHRLVMPGIDWSEVALHLPMALRSWTGGFREDHDVVQLARTLVANGLTEGWVLAETVRQLAAGTVSGEPDGLLEARLVLVLQDLGIRILDEDPDMWPGLSRSEETDADADEGPVEDALAFLDSLSDPGSDLAHVLGREAARSRPLSASQEGELFRRRDNTLATIGAALRGQPAIAQVLQEWAALLEAGRLAPGEVVRPEYIGTSGHAYPSPTIPMQPGSFQPDVGTDLEPAEDAGPDDTETTAMLAAVLRDAAAALSVDDLPLVMRRVMELAERKLGLDQATSSGSRDRGRLARERGKEAPRGAGVTADADRLLLGALGSLREIRADAAHSYQRMVLWQARHFAGHLPLADLVQEGHLGLLKAFEKFEPSRGFRFQTYALWWIRQSMHRAIQDQGRIIRIPVHLLEFEARTRSREERLRTRGWEERRIEEAGAFTGATLRDRHKLLRARIAIVNLDETTREPEDDDDEEPRSRADAAAFRADHLSPLEEVLLADLRRCLKQGLDQLHPRQRDILVLRFGLCGGVPMTLEEIGTQYGVTRERIRQVEHKAVERMRRLLPSKHFDAMRP